MPDDLYQRYQAAHLAWKAHTGSCPHCTGGPGCRDGQRLYESFVRLQDAYLAKQRKG
ncbi:hypothetical protein AB0D37_43225 [Streptomyces sp. NPDC048384]|uniref:hypothetical protein n=1 Tax=Streptomyces sp. NPDC048384 TaxID=3155487 RepID=UPI0034412D97